MASRIRTKRCTIPSRKSSVPAMTTNAKKMLEDWSFEHVSIEPPKYLERFKKDQRQIGDY